MGTVLSRPEDSHTELLTAADADTVKVQWASMGATERLCA